MASQAEKDAYCDAKDKGSTNVSTTSTEADVYAKAMIVKEVVAPEIALATTDNGLKPWAIDSGCTSHFSPNKSQFITYTPYATQHHICLGDSSLTPLLGEGTVCLMCVVNMNPVTPFIHNVQYIPGLSYGLLSCKVLLQRGLKVVLENNTCKVYHKDGNLIVKSNPNLGQLFFLHTLTQETEKPPVNDSALVASPSFNLIHKQLAHPRKDILEWMIQKKSILGLDEVQGDAKDLDWTACIQAKMIRAPFQSGHEIAPTCLGQIHSNLCSPMEVMLLGKN